MTLRMLIADRRPEIRAAWSEVFRGIEDVALLDGDSRTLVEQGVDAELMLGMFAHERYGGSPRHSEVQILSTRGEPGMPPWVVTDPPFGGHLEDRYRHNGTMETVVVPDRQLTSPDESYIIFTKIFERIEEFNAGNAEPKIRMLGFELDSLFFPRGNPRKEAEAARNAYMEHYGNVIKQLVK